VTGLNTANRLAGYGIAVGLPAGWEGRIYRRAASIPPAPVVGADLPADPIGGAATNSVARWHDERTHPVLHLANFGLPGARGDFGTGAVERMSAEHVFIALLQFGTDCLGTALYAPQGFPRLAARDFNPNGLQRKVAGQAGFQHFFTAAGRPLCLYVVLGAHRQAGALCPQINDVLARIEVSR
jgi:hypothetical protein